MAFGAVGAAYVELGLKDTEFNAGLARSDAKLQAFGGSAGKTMSGFQKVGTVAFAAVGAAAVLGIGKAVDATVKLGTEVLHLSRQLGITTEEASKLKFAGEELGIGVDQLS